MSYFGTSLTGCHMYCVDAVGQRAGATIVAGVTSWRTTLLVEDRQRLASDEDQDEDDRRRWTSAPPRAARTRPPVRLGEAVARTETVPRR